MLLESFCEIYGATPNNWPNHARIAGLRGTALMWFIPVNSDAMFSIYTNIFTKSYKFEWRMHSNWWDRKFQINFIRFPYIHSRRQSIWVHTFWKYHHGVVPNPLAIFSGALLIPCDTYRREANALLGVLSLSQLIVYLKGSEGIQLVP